MPVPARPRTKLFSAIALGAGCVFLAFCPDVYPVMLVRCFLPYWALSAVLIACYFFWTRAITLGIVALAGAVLMAFQVLNPLNEAPDKKAGAHLFRIGQFNVLQPNVEHLGIIAAAKESEADVLSFQEVDAVWVKTLEDAFGAAYPYRIVLPRTDLYGIALFSKLPLHDPDTLSFRGVPAIQANVTTRHGEVSITTVHARSPIPYEAFAMRNEQFRQLASELGGDNGPVVLIGDLNAVAWDDALVALRSDAGLVSASRAFVPTFPSILGVAILPIDHVLGSSDICISAVCSSGLPGSDHCALIADIALAR